MTQIFDTTSLGTVRKAAPIIIKQTCKSIPEAAQPLANSFVNLSSKMLMSLVQVMKFLHSRVMTLRRLTVTKPRGALSQRIIHFTRRMTAHLLIICAVNEQNQTVAHEALGLCH